MAHARLHLSALVAAPLKYNMYMLYMCMYILLCMYM